MPSPGVARLPFLIGVLLLGCLGTAWLLERRAHLRLQSNHARLAARLAQAEQQLEQATPDPSSIANSRRSLESLQAEVLQLRGEVAQLRRSQPASAPGRRPAQATQPTTHTAEDPVAGTGPGWMSTRVPLNGGALFPAWTSANGRQAWVLAIPSAAQPDVGSDNVLLEQLIFEGAPEVLASLGIGNSPTGGGPGFAALGAEDSRALLERLRKTDGIDVLSAPRIITGGGHEAQVSIGNDTGGQLNLSVVPNLAPDGNVDLRLKVERTEGTGKP